MRLAQVCDHHYCAASRTWREPQSSAGAANITCSNPGYILEIIRLSLESVVGLVTRLATEKSINRGSIPNRCKRFLLPQNAQIGSEALPDSYSIGTGALSQTVKRPVREVDH
jgi:hypothetical protein